VQDLYDRRGLEDFADRTMGALLRIVSADRIVYGDFDVERQAARLAMQPAVVKDPDGTVDGTVNGALGSLERDFGSHPLFRYYLQTGDGRAQKASQVMTKSRYERYGETDEFTRQLGAKYQMGLFFPAGPSVVTAILLTRSQRDFTERERALLNRLYPHLVQAFRQTASLNRLSRDVDGLFEMLEGPTSSVIVLSETGRVKRWTEQAKSWIAQHCRTPFPASGDRLPDCFARHRPARARRAGDARASPRDPLIVDKNQAAHRPVDPRSFPRRALPAAQREARRHVVERAR
jgi:hypothetical protein